MVTYDATRTRLQLLANGYVPTPNLDKRCMLKGWASKDYPLSLVPDTITLWNKAYRHFRATGVLVRNGLMPIDLDIADRAMSDAVLDKLLEINPIVHNQAPWRTGKPPKLMVFTQWQSSNKYPSMFSRQASAKFADANGKTHQIEVFGGAPSSSGGSSKQVGAFGPHSYVTDEAGEIVKPWQVAREYSWEDDRSLLDVPLMALPTMTQDQVWELLAAFEELAEAAGWVKQIPPKTTSGQFIYDITPTTEFEPQHGEVCVYADLDEGMRVSGSFIDNSTRRRDKCSVLYCKARGVLGVYDHEDDAWHLPKSAEPPTLDNAAPLDLSELADQAGPELPKGSKRDDFHAFLPTHQYIYKHTGELWHIGGINTTLDKVVVGQKAKKQTKKQIEDGAEPEMVDVTIPPSLWLDRHRPITQMSWAPGQPQIIKDKTVSDGGWSAVEGAVVFNKYRPPAPSIGTTTGAKAWLDLVEQVYPDSAAHIVAFLAHRVQRAAEKINHALVLTGSPGIGKDTLLEPLKHAVGPWNFREISPHDVTSNNNDFMQAVVLRVSEARDLGDIDRYKFYEATKTMTAAPPDMVRVNTKYVPQFYIPNVAGVIFTTNYGYDGLFLPPDDRRHYVAGTELTRADFDEAYFNDIWRWYTYGGGLADVGAYLAAYDLAGFDAKAPPVKTAAFWRMVDAGRASEEPEFRDALEKAGGGTMPSVVTLLTIQAHASFELTAWIQQPKNRRNASRRMESIGYEVVRNADREDGLWRLGGRPQIVYGLRSLSAQLRYRAAEDLRDRVDEALKAEKSNVIPLKS